MNENLISLMWALGALACAALAEALWPLRKRSAWNGWHLLPNLGLTALTFAGNMALNIPIVAGLLWMEARGLGALNAFGGHPALEAAVAILVLDLTWYVTHTTMHAVPFLWRFHAVHHSDPAVDATTAIRQHPGEVLIRFVFLAPAALAVGASPVAFALYRVWTAAHGFFAHANLRLPGWLDTAVSFVFVSPNMHKCHHSRDKALTDTNYGNIFSLWDRAFRTFTPAARGQAIVYGLEGRDGARDQSFAGLLALPFSQRPQGASSSRQPT